MKKVSAYLCADGTVHRKIGDARKQDDFIEYNKQIHNDKHTLDVEAMKWMSEQDAFISKRCYVCTKQYAEGTHAYVPVYSAGGDLLEVQGSIGAMEYFQNDPNFFGLADGQGMIELFLVPKEGQILGCVTEQGGLNYVETP